jgi:septum formation protein
MSNIILASQSPRRQDLLNQVGIDFKVICSNCDESYPDYLTPEQVVMALSGKKADSVFDKIISEGDLTDDFAVIAADTIVALGDKVLGKPKDKEDAFNMLKALSGKKHSVYTGVTILYAAKGKISMDSLLSKADVSFYPLTEDEINDYISTGEPMDKAGAYGIQGMGAALVEGISGDFYTIVGLPVARVYHSLKSNGFIK